MGRRLRRHPIWSGGLVVVVAAVALAFAVIRNGSSDGSLDGNSNLDIGFNASLGSGASGPGAAAATTATPFSLAVPHPDRSALHRELHVLPESTECTLFLRQTELVAATGDDREDEHTDRTWMCELALPRQPAGRGGDPEGPAPPPPSTRRVLVGLSGLDGAFFEHHGAASGESVLRLGGGCYLAGQGAGAACDGDAGTGGRDTACGNADPRAMPSGTAIVVPPGATAEVVDTREGEGEAPHNVFVRGRPPRSRPGGKGVLSTLVVRIVAADGTGPTANEEATRKNVFTDPVCLRSQLGACSKQQALVEAFHGETETGVWIEEGVTTLQIDGGAGSSNYNSSIYTNTYSGIGIGDNGRADKHNHRPVLGRAAETAEARLGPLGEQFDLVLFCIPSGTGTHWKAEATIGRFDSYYNDEWCGYISAQMHEVGHNLGLAHSGQADENNIRNEYLDKSGMMGISYKGKNSPRMCYNAAKSYQLEWYKRQRLSIDPTAEVETKNDNVPNGAEQTKKRTRTFVMNGVADYKRNGPTHKRLVSLRLVQSSGTTTSKRKSKPRTDYYVGYNRAVGPNADTKEDANAITVLEALRAGGSGARAKKSWKLASLSYKGQRFFLRDFGRSSAFVEVRLLSGNLSSGPRDAEIAITSYHKAATGSECGVGGTATDHKGRTNRKGNTGFFELEGKTDEYGYETWWQLRLDDGTDGNGSDSGSDSESDDEGYYVDFGSGYGPSESFGATHLLCPGECYVFSIHDLYGDGISEDSGGYYRLSLAGVDLFSSGSSSNNTNTNNFGFSESHRFCVPPLAIPDAVCKDRGRLRYKNDRTKNCGWVGERGPKKTRKRCKKRWKGRTLAEWCPRTCGACSVPETEAAARGTLGK